MIAHKNTNQKLRLLSITCRVRSIRSGHSDKPVLAAAGKTADHERASSYAAAGSPAKTKSSKDMVCDCDSDQPDSNKQVRICQ